MSTRRERSRLLLLAGLAGVVCCALAATAFGYVQVYGNNFNNKPQYREIKTLTTNNHCKRKYSEKHERMRATATDGPRHCRFKPPAQGSNPLPDHRFEVVGRILRDTKAIARTDAYIAIAVRVGGGDRYELRVFPKDRDYELTRKPGGPQFPDAGGNGAIKGIGHKNKLRLQVEGARVRAFVNGTQIADITDPNHNEIRGKRVQFEVGNLRNMNKATLATFDGIKLSVPTP